MKRLLTYLPLMLVLLSGCQGTAEHGQSSPDTFYASRQDRSQSNTAGGDLLLVKLPERLDNQVVRHKVLTIYYNKYYRIPNCVAYELTSTMTSMADAPDSENRDNYQFYKDDKADNCPDWWEYKGSDYTRGHMAPAMDMRGSRQTMQDCFLMSNICPQAEGLNDGEWRHVEEAVHTWSRSVKRLIVFTGPIITNNMKRIGKHRDIAVPEAFFKVVYAPDQNRAIAFIMENKKMLNSWTNYATTIDEVERRTGYDFLSTLDDPVENVLETKENIKDWPKYYPRR